MRWIFFSLLLLLSSRAIDVTAQDVQEAPAPWVTRLVEASIADSITITDDFIRSLGIDPHHYSGSDDQRRYTGQLADGKSYYLVHDTLEYGLMKPHLYLLQPTSEQDDGQTYSREEPAGHILLFNLEGRLLSVHVSGPWQTLTSRQSLTTLMYVDDAG